MKNSELYKDYHHSYKRLKTYDVSVKIPSVYLSEWQNYLEKKVQEFTDKDFYIEGELTVNDMVFKGKVNIYED